MLLGRKARIVPGVPVRSARMSSASRSSEDSMYSFRGMGFRALRLVADEPAADREPHTSERKVLVVDRVQHAAGGELANPDLVAVEQVVRPWQNGGARLVQRLHVLGGQGE